MQYLLVKDRMSSREYGRTPTNLTWIEGAYDILTVYIRKA
jgi:hypothetical protein